MIDIVIPVHNAVGAFRDMMASLVRFTLRESYRLIIIDDASGQDTKTFIDTIDADLVIRNDFQQWFTRAVNRGLDATENALVAVLNTDIVLCPAWDTVLCSYFDDPRVMLAGSDYRPGQASHDYPKRPDYITGHCWMVRRSFMEEHGTLDENHAHIDSDRLFSYRVTDMGFTAVRDLSLPVAHGLGPSWGRRIGDLPRPGTLPVPNNRELPVIPKSEES